ncbi:MAG: nucleotidyltransferase family protein [Cyclobacteriaceae bacterium]
MSNSSTTGLILLAAGSSRRLGQPKQLLEFRKKPLLQHSIDCANRVPFDSCLLILGSNSQIITKRIVPGNFQVLLNEAWEEGVASSIHFGLSELIAKSPGIENVLFLLSDQPYLSTSHLNRLLTEHEMGITASAYAGEIGVPVIFNRTYFDELLFLDGDQGAKKIVMKHRNKVKIVPFKGGEMDIDTMEDYDRLRGLDH